MFTTDTYLQTIRSVFQLLDRDSAADLLGALRGANSRHPSEPAKQIDGQEGARGTSWAIQPPHDAGSPKDAPAEFGEAALRLAVLAASKAKYVTAWLLCRLSNCVVSARGEAPGDLLIIVSIWTSIQVGSLVEVGMWTVRLAASVVRNADGSIQSTPHHRSLHWFAEAGASLLRRDSLRAQRGFMRALDYANSGAPLVGLSAADYRAVLWLGLAHALSADNRSFQALRTFRCAMVQLTREEPVATLVPPEHALLGAGLEALRLGWVDVALRYLSAASKTTKSCGWQVKYATACADVMRGRLLEGREVIASESRGMEAGYVTSLQKYVPHSVVEGVLSAEWNLKMIDTRGDPEGTGAPARFP